MNESSQGGITLVSSLTILFIALKMFGITPIATWSWWWVFTPVWITFVVCIILLTITLLLKKRVWRNTNE